MPSQTPSAATTDGPFLVDRNEIARRLGVTTRHLLNMRRQGLPAVVLGTGVAAAW